jgi:hypothetical protein
MPDEYAIHDVQQSDQPSFGMNGSVQMMRVVTYYVGPHGPFRLVYPKDQATADQINHDMNQECVLLRSTSGPQA